MNVLRGKTSSPRRAARSPCNNNRRGGRLACPVKLLFSRDFSTLTRMYVYFKIHVYYTVYVLAGTLVFVENIVEPVDHTRCVRIRIRSRRRKKNDCFKTFPLYFRYFYPLSQVFHNYMYKITKLITSNKCIINLKYSKRTCFLRIYTKGFCIITRN